MPQDLDKLSLEDLVSAAAKLYDRWTLYADLHGVSARPDPQVPGYVELDAGWKASDRLELSLAGFDLLRPWHQEYVFSGSDRIPCSVSFDTRPRF